MDYLDDLDCPQYVCFEKLLSENESSVDGIERTPSSASVKHSHSTDMDTEDESISQEMQSETENIQSTQYLDITRNNLGVSPAASEYSTGDFPVHHPKFSPAASEYSVGDFPIHRPKNVSLPDKPPEKKVSKAAKVSSSHLMEIKKRKREDEHIPLAEQVAAFQTKTPARFHSTTSKGYQPAAHWSPPVIHPKSPTLHAAKRIRGINVLSREEMEKIEEEEMKEYKFHARPLNRKILERPQTLKFSKKTPTRPKPLHLRTAERATEIYSKKKEEEKPYEFHAHPVPKSVLNGPTGLKEKPIHPVTEARTPNFTLKTRMEKRKQEMKMNVTCIGNQPFKALPAPVNSAPFVVKHEKKNTKVQPFSFDTRDKEMMVQKEKKILEEIEKENSVFVFKAQPLPPTPSSLPEVQKKPATCPEPFNFLLENRPFRNSFNTSTEQQSKPAFKAQPATVLQKAPFVPEKPPKPSCEIKEFQLHTDIRAAERQKLKEINEIKEHEKEMALLRMKELREAEEQREILKLRKETVHKANPIRQYKPLEIKPSAKLPTEPVSPKFKTEERLQLRH